MLRASERWCWCVCVFVAMQFGLFGVELPRHQLVESVLVLLAFLAGSVSNLSLVNKMDGKKSSQQVPAGLLAGRCVQ